MLCVFVVQIFISRYLSYILGLLQMQIRIIPHISCVISFNDNVLLTCFRETSSALGKMMVDLFCLKLELHFGQESCGSLSLSK